MKPIAHIETGFKDKFGIPRQSGLAKGMDGKIIFEKEYNIPDAFKGLEDFSHIWIIWGFSEIDKEWSPTVRPPKLGGNKRIGVFATRSPFRPNNLGLSCVKLERIEFSDGITPFLTLLPVLYQQTPTFSFLLSWILLHPVNNLFENRTSPGMLWKSFE